MKPKLLLHNKFSVELLQLVIYPVDLYQATAETINYSQNFLKRSILHQQIHDTHL